MFYITYRGAQSQGEAPIALSPPVHSDFVCSPHDHRHVLPSEEKGSITAERGSRPSAFQPGLTAFAIHGTETGKHTL